jgi:hypothetical protein
VRRVAFHFLKNQIKVLSCSLYLELICRIFRENNYPIDHDQHFLFYKGVFTLIKGRRVLRIKY